MPPISLNFNLPFDEAIAQMASRGVVLPDIYYRQLRGIHKQLAFSIANVAKLDQLQLVLDSLANHLKTGGTFASWQKHVDVKALGLPKHRLDNIFRTNIQQAYNHGHWQHAVANKSTHGYLLYDAINDSRTRPTHKANDGIIRKIDDPIWRRIWFSRSVYRCRCRLISLTEKQAIARSGEQQGIYKTATEDPLRDKAWDAVDVMNADVMGFGVERAIVKRLADSQNPVLKQAFVKAIAVGEAQQLALNYGVKEANYAGMLDIANEANIVLSEFKQRGLPIPDNVKVDENQFLAWESQLNKDLSKTPAAFTFSQKSGQTYLFIKPSDSYWVEAAKTAKIEYDTGYWSSESPHHAMLHELGHNAHYLQAQDKYIGYRSTALTASQSIIAAKVSKYALESQGEFVAETFVLIMQGGKVDDDVLELYQLLEGKLL
jgi:SPP1 gp7 family putative phage head morphogenesis protein